MTSTFFGLELGKRGLYAQQAALYTTGHNIANANTPGYTRQRAEMQATTPIPNPGLNNDVSAGQMGTGVEVNRISRLREDYLDVQYRGENKNLGYWEAKSDTYTKLEEVVNEPSDTGIANAMDQFWEGWQELAKNPESSAARAIVRQRGIALTDSFNYLNDSLGAMQTDLNKVITAKTDEVNSLAKQIGDLNGQISRIVPNNYQPNDLYDQRDALLDQLSKLVNIDVQSSQNGMVKVYIGSNPSTELVNNSTYNSITVPTASTGEISVQGGNPPVSVTTTLTAGDLLGRIESLNKTIPEFKTNLDTMVATFAKAVNDLHRTGLNLDDIAAGKTSATADQLNFFVDGDPNNSNSSSNINAGNITINPAIMDSLNKIAAASAELGGTSSSGNATMAQKIAQVKYNTLSFQQQGVTIASSAADDFYQNMVAKLGIDSQQAQRMQDNSEVMLNQVDNRRQSVSGVSLDEEMSNMIRFQQAYNASARLVTAMDEVLDKVINGMGRVGL